MVAVSILTLGSYQQSADRSYFFLLVRLGAMSKDAYDAILADGATSAATDLEYAGCLISRVSKIPPFYFPQSPNHLTAGK